MNKPITVKILVTIDMAHFDACTLCFESLRIGWPTAEIWVYLNNADGPAFRAAEAKLEGAESRNTNAVFHLIQSRRVHHADWIREQVEQEYPGPLVIADPDIVYWKSCEDWNFPQGTLLAGYYHPRMWNDFAKCVSVARIHTSMMVFPDTQKLWDAIKQAYPLAHRPHGEYCPCDPFMPAVRFDEGEPVFWDSCSNLYNMLPPQSVVCFGENNLKCFDHLNSASFYDVMYERLEGSTKEGFAITHRDWVKHPTPGLWKLVDEYYRQKQIEGVTRRPGMLHRERRET